MAAGGEKKRSAGVVAAIRIWDNATLGSDSLNPSPPNKPSLHLI